jgi:hypothetical protein
VLCEFNSGSRVASVKVEECERRSSGTTLLQRTSAVHRQERHERPARSAQRWRTGDSVALTEESVGGHAAAAGAQHASSHRPWRRPTPPATLRATAAGARNFRKFRKVSRTKGWH